MVNSLLFSPKIKKSLAFLVCGVGIVFALWYIRTLIVENGILENENNMLISANNEIMEAWVDERLKTQEQINILLKSQNEVKKEIQYVEKVKYRIIKDNNASCVGAINDIFHRLRTQRNNDSTDKN